MFYDSTQGVALAEVEIDTLTGDFSVLRSDIKMVEQTSFMSLTLGYRSDYQRCD